MNTETFSKWHYFFVTQVTLSTHFRLFLFHTQRIIRIVKTRLDTDFIKHFFQNSSSNLDACWQRDFERRYIELEELGRGRFSVVRRCQEILTGNEVAVKFINRRKQIREETQKEFEILSILNHPNIVTATGLFLTATSDAIVMKL